MDPARIDERSATPKKMALYSVAFVAANAAFVIALFGPSLHSQRGSASSPLADETGDSQSAGPLYMPGRPALKIDALRLYNNLAANDPITIQMTSEMGVEVKGMIDSIRSDDRHNVVIDLLSGDEYHPLGMTLRHGDSSQAGKLSEGQTITIRCDRLMREPGAPHGYECAIVGIGT